MRLIKWPNTVRYRVRELNKITTNKGSSQQKS